MTPKQQADAAYTLEQLLEGKREVRTRATFADWIFAATDAVERITQLEQRVAELKTECVKKDKAIEYVVQSDETDTLDCMDMRVLYDAVKPATDNKEGE